MVAPCATRRGRAVEAVSLCDCRYSLIPIPLKGAAFMSARETSNKTRILVVEDDPHILLGLEEILKSEGFEVAVCNRGDRALEAMSKFRPSLIVLDVMLPGVSGYDLCRQIRARPNNTPVLMLTA